MQPRLRTFSTRLRQNQSDAEQKLWRKLRDRQIRGLKFLRQHPLGQYIVDFCCPAHLLIVELDRGQHAQQREIDQRRTLALESLGFRVVRFLDHEVLTQLEGVLDQILHVVDSKNPSTHPHPNPLLFKTRENEIRSYSVKGLREGKHPHPPDGSFQEKSLLREKEKMSHRVKPRIERQTTLAKVGYRMPAEWEGHEATWLGWPHNTTDWPGKMAIIPGVYGEIVRHLADGELLRILVNSKSHELKARRVLERVGVDLVRVEFFRIPTNRGWTRDFGPIFIQPVLPNSE